MSLDPVSADPVSAPRPSGADRISRRLLALYGTSVMLSASLLFMVQPMVARMVLPTLGGSPATWTTCMVFFQLMLLLAYLYVHVTALILSRRAQSVLHVLLLLAAMLSLPFALPRELPGDASPVGWLAMALTSSIGLPFFAVAGTAPLLQRWFAGVTGREPYFLYAVSNAGSLVGLLSYPFVVERTLTLAEQVMLWTAGFAALTFGIAACAFTLRQAWTPATAIARGRETAAPPVSARQRAAWLILSFVPSSLLLGVTTKLTTDMAAVPLLWVVPFSLYLITFIVAFSHLAPRIEPWTTRVAAPLLLVTITTLFVVPGATWALALHLLTFTVIAMMCHGELAARRPHPSALTGYYLVLAAGGALGGLFNALVAPVIFTTVAEYPLVLALAAFLRPPPRWRHARLEPLGMVVGVPLMLFAFGVVVWALGVGEVAFSPLMITLALAAALVLVFANRTIGFAQALAVAVAVFTLTPPQAGSHTVYAERSFFGVYRVTQDDPPTVRRLLHGTTVHGREKLNDSRCEPTSYYHRSGPIGQVFTEWPRRAGRVAVIGLGAGELACYAAPGSEWTFFEIDEAVERIARDPSLFSFLQRAPSAPSIVIGDGRLKLAETVPGTFDIVVVDAFSSDAIPVHLLTREFVAIALERLRPDGLLAFHISNRHLDLAPVLAAAAASLQAETWEQQHTPTHEDAIASRWVVISRPGTLIQAATDPRWQRLSGGTTLWTDDFSNILQVWRPTSAP